MRGERMKDFGGVKRVWSERVLSKAQTLVKSAPVGNFGDRERLPSAARRGRNTGCGS